MKNQELKFMDNFEVLILCNGEVKIIFMFPKKRILRKIIVRSTCFNIF